MKRIDKVGLRENLDRLGVAWARLGPEDEGVRSKMQEEIFCMACELYYNCTDEITTVFLNDWPKFDPEKGSLSGFFAARINLRGKDTNRWNRSERQVWETDPVTGKKKRVYRSAIVQEGDSSEDGGSSLQDAVQADRWTESGGNFSTGSQDDPERRVRLDETTYELIIAMLELPRRLQGRANNPTRLNYFRLFFTNGVATYLHHALSPEEFQKRERDLFAVLKLEFLDYFMANLCRTAADICYSPLKPYGALVQGKPMDKETELPLPDKVYISYLDRVEDQEAVKPSAIDGQRKEYKKFLCGVLGIQCPPAQQEKQNKRAFKK